MMETGNSLSEAAADAFLFLRQPLRPSPVRAAANNGKAGREGTGCLMMFQSRHKSALRPPSRGARIGSAELALTSP